MVASGFSFLGRLVLFAAAERAKAASMKPTPGSRQRDKIALGWQQRLH
jgi:hypothetical protein